MGVSHAHVPADAPRRDNRGGQRFRRAWTSGLFCELGFQLGDAGSEGGDGAFDFGGGVARRDVFRAVPVVADDVDQNQPLGDRAGGGFGEGFDEVGVLARVEHAGVAEDLQPRAMRVVHEEEADAVVDGEVAGREELAIALVIGEAELRRREHAQEAGRAAAVLHVGPAGLADGGKVERIPALDEIDLVVGERVGRDVPRQPG